jgi:hypothetical protein
MRQQHAALSTNPLKSYSFSKREHARISLRIIFRNESSPIWLPRGLTQDALSPRDDCREIPNQRAFSKLSGKSLMVDCVVLQGDDGCQQGPTARPGPSQRDVLHDKALPRP